MRPPTSIVAPIDDAWRLDEKDIRAEAEKVLAEYEKE
jgi:hypothetical protein